MAFPDDLTDVVAFKIHPAIGIARISNNDDYFVFGTTPASYKSNGLMKRQAVQFRLFAYGANHLGLGEVTPSLLATLGIAATWSATVVNRKLEFTALEQGLTDAAQRVFGASASSDDANGGALVGSLPNFAEGAAIPLGQISDTGLFVPPRGGVYREAAGTAVPSYPDFTAAIADTSGDGTISVSLDGAAAAIPVLPAWIVVAPQDFSPDQMPAQTPDESLLLHLRQLVATTGGSTGSIHNETARRIDEMAIAPASADWAPGFEVSFGERSAVTNLKALFYDSGTNAQIDPREMRVMRRADGNIAGAEPGQLTSGLCSPWQTDFTACVGYWSESLPRYGYLDEATNTRVSMYRRQYDDPQGTQGVLTVGDDFVDHQDKIGVARLVAGKLVETERNPGDDI